MKEKTILHSDVNNFFASVECANNPELKGKPVAVTGNPKKRTGIILAKNELAKAQGVKTGEAIWQAKQKCPDLVSVGPHYALYEEISKKLHELYLEYTDFVEPLGLDECWLDVTDSLKFLNKSGEEIANEIRARVKEQFGFTVSVGVSFSKLYAKLGSDLKKPDATTLVKKEELEKKIFPLPLSSIVGIGNKLATKFAKMNILTIGDFANLKESFVNSIMGKTGVELHQKINGQFVDDVGCYFLQEPPKSIGNGTTTIEDITSRQDIEKVVRFLSEKIAKRMVLGSFEASTISVSLKTNTFKKFRHSKTVFPIRSSEELFTQSMNIIDEFWNYTQQVRAIRICVSNLQKVDQFRQLNFFQCETDRLSQSLKEIKSKYGSDKIFIASDTVSFINRKNEDEEHPI